MLGNAVRKQRQTSRYWLWCCEGHDGTWRDFIRVHRGAQRVREKREWRKVWGL